MVDEPASVEFAEFQLPVTAHRAVVDDSGAGGDLVVGDHVGAAPGFIAGPLDDEVGGGVVGAVETRPGRAGAAVR